MNGLPPVSAPNELKQRTASWMVIGRRMLTADVYQPDTHKCYFRGSGMAVFYGLSGSKEAAFVH